MYKIGDEGGLYRSLPPNMILDKKKLRAFCLAFDRKMGKLSEMMNKLIVWGDLDNVDPKYYDALASCLDAPYYRADYDNATKLRVIKSAILKRRFAGTKKGMKELVKAIYPGGQFVPWYEYGGKPYHFKVIANSLSQEAVTLSIKDVKAARSVLDYIQSFCNLRMKESVICLATSVQDVHIDNNLYGDYKASLKEYGAESTHSVASVHIDNNLYGDYKSNTNANTGIGSLVVPTIHAEALE